MNEVRKKIGDSKAIVTNQQGIHESLENIVKKHLCHEFLKPISAHTQQAFDDINAIVNNFDGDIILDSCCGVGQSTRLLAIKNPDKLVIGVDKSANRINRNVDEHFEHDLSNVKNYHLVRADLNDFYRLVKKADWRVSIHYVLYPNPWPKSKHVQRRWHGSSIFPTMLAIGHTMILRSNWRLYLEEFQFSSAIAGKKGTISVVNENDAAMTPFEAKYHASDQQCWQLVITL